MPVGHRVDGTKCFLFAFRIIFWTASKYILRLSKNRQWRWKPEAKIIKLQRLKKVSDFNLYFSMLNSPIRQCNFFQKHLNKNNKNNNIKHARKKKTVRSSVWNGLFWILLIATAWRLQQYIKATLAAIKSQTVVVFYVRGSSSLGASLSQPAPGADLLVTQGGHI